MAGRDLCLCWGRECPVHNAACLGFGMGTLGLCPALCPLPLLSFYILICFGKHCFYSISTSVRVFLFYLFWREVCAQSGTGCSNQHTSPASCTWQSAPGAQGGEVMWQTQLMKSSPTQMGKLLSAQNNFLGIYS